MTFIKVLISDQSVKFVLYYFTKLHPKYVQSNVFTLKYYWASLIWLGTWNVELHVICLERFDLLFGIMVGAFWNGNHLWQVVCHIEFRIAVGIPLSWCRMRYLRKATQIENHSGHDFLIYMLLLITIGHSTFSPSHTSAPPPSPASCN